MVQATRKSLEPWIYDSINYYQHQVEGVRHLARQKSFLLGDDMGLGKCLQSLTVFAIDVFQGWAERCLIVCPILLKDNWADEIKKFTRFPCVVLDGTTEQRARQIVEFSMIQGPKILIVNYEQVTAHLAALNALDFHVCICDECHYLKNPKSKRTKSALELRAHRWFMLSGTPMLNQVDELWVALHKIDPAGYPDYYRFVNRYCTTGGYKGKQVKGVKNDTELTERLHRVMLRRMKEDVLDLPPVQIMERRVNLHPEQQEIYDLAYEEFKVIDPDGEMEDIDNALTRFLRLKQVCGTTFPFNGLDVSSKLDLCVSDNQEIFRTGRKVVMFTQFRDVLDCYEERIRDLGMPFFKLNGSVAREDRFPMTKRWAATDGPAVIGCMLQIAREGVNLVAASDACFLDELFVPGLNQQAVDRLHRIGADRTQPVRVWKYIARGTIESRIHEILRHKTKLSKQIVDSDPNWKRALVKAVMEDEDDRAA